MFMFACEAVWIFLPRNRIPILEDLDRGGGIFNEIFKNKKLIDYQTSGVFMNVATSCTRNYNFSTINREN